MTVPHSVISRNLYHPLTHSHPHQTDSSNRFTAARSPIPAPLPAQEKTMRDPATDFCQKFKEQSLPILIQQIDPVLLKSGNEPLLKSRIEELVEERLNSEQLAIPTKLRQRLLQEIVDEMIGFGPLEPLLRDDSISEIMVNGPQSVYIERKGLIELSEVRFNSDADIRRVIDRIISPLGRRIDESSPMVDARLPDGSRVNAIIPPLALNGPTITIRKFKSQPLRIEDLLQYKSLSQGMALFLAAAVKSRMNIIISGGTGSGKTTMLNTLSSFIPDNERIITIEDAAELRLQQSHVVRLETRPRNIEGKGEVTIRDLVRNSLRMRPDRIIVGECRGGEALDMLQAMNTGHDGSLTTLHANSARDCLARLETLVMMSGMELPQRAIREQIASAIHYIVQVSRLSDGSRRVTGITEIQGMEGQTITTQDLFRFEQRGVAPDGKILGHLRGMGIISKHIERFRSMGYPLPSDVFQTSIEV